MKLLGDKDGADQARTKAKQLFRAIEEKKGRGRATDYFLLGMRHFERTDVAGAIRYFDAALREQPDSFSAQYFLAVCYLQCKNPAAAKASLSACLEKDPRFIWNYLLRGYAFVSLADQSLSNRDPKVREAAEQYFDDADRDFSQAEKLNPSDVESYALLNNRGLARLYQRHWDEAIADFEQAIKLKPILAAAYMNLANLHLERDKDYAKALAALDQAIAVKTPDLPKLYRDRSRINRLRKNYEAALADTQAALKHDDDSDRSVRHDAEVRQAQSLLSLKRYSEAIAACDRAVKLNPEVPLTYQVRAAAYAEQGKYDEAARDYDNYLKYKKGDVEPSIYEARAVMRGTIRDLPGAIEDFTRALASRTSRPSTKYGPTAIAAGSMSTPTCRAWA